jgi:hypothetical protein
MPAIDYQPMVFAGYIPLDVTLTRGRGTGRWRDRYGVQEWLPAEDLFCATLRGKYR